MKIIIYGTGGVGGYFGTRLAQAGNDVTFIARGKHLEAIQKKGIQLKSIQGDFHLKEANATEDFSTIKDAELVIIATKTWQLKGVVEKIKPFLDDKTMVLSLLNGADNAEQICSLIDKKHVLGGLCKIIAKIEDYGIINHTGAEPFIAFGELDNTKSERILRLKKIFDNAKILNQNPEDINVAIWSKFLFITTISAIGGLTRISLGEMRTNLEIRKIMELSAQEILQVANAKEVHITQETIDKAFYFIDKLPYETTASLQRDIMERKPSELESQVGAVHKMGKELGVPTPINSFIYHCLIPQEKIARNKL